MDIDDPRVMQVERTGYIEKYRDDCLYCDCCDEEIENGDRYYDIGGVAYCERCLKEEFGKIA